VVLDAHAFIKGWLIATSLWVGVLLLLVAAGYGVPASRDGTDAGYVWGFLGMVILYGFGVSLVVAAPLAWVLAYLQVHASPGARHRRCLGPGSRFLAMLVRTLPWYTGPHPETSEAFLKSDSPAPRNQPHCTQRSQWLTPGSRRRRL
jgi:hypothetical protein